MQVWLQFAPTRGIFRIKVYPNTWPQSAGIDMGALLPRSCDVSFQVLIDSNIAGIHVHSGGPARIYLASLTSSRIPRGRHSSLIPALTWEGRNDSCYGTGGGKLLGIGHDSRNIIRSSSYNVYLSHALSVSLHSVLPPSTYCSHF